MTLNSETLKTLICPLNHVVYKHTYYHTPNSTVYIEPPREFHPSFFLINAWIVSDHYLKYDEQEKWVYAENFLLKKQIRLATLSSNYTSFISTYYLYYVATKISHEICDEIFSRKHLKLILCCNFNFNFKSDCIHSSW